jgi:hypothetical protein
LLSIYAFFSLDTDSGNNIVNSAIMINIQELASAMSETGLTGFEGSTIRPTWKAWALAEAKRRTLYTMYMFDHVFNCSNNTACYRATELGQLPASSNKALWAASDEAEWERAYDRHISNWPLGGPLIEDFWPNTDEAIGNRRRERADRWLEDVDEFGILLFSTSNLTQSSD